jgi:hypothetical protein
MKLVVAMLFWNDLMFPESDPTIRVCVNTFVQNTAPIKLALNVDTSPLTVIVFDPDIPPMS